MRGLSREVGARRFIDGTQTTKAVKAARERLGPNGGGAGPLSSERKGVGGGRQAVGGGRRTVQWEQISAPR